MEGEKEETNELRVEGGSDEGYEVDEGRKGGDEGDDGREDEGSVRGDEDSDSDDGWVLAERILKEDEETWPGYSPDFQEGEYIHWKSYGFGWCFGWKDGFKTGWKGGFKTGWKGGFEAGHSAALKSLQEVIEDPENQHTPVAPSVSSNEAT